MTPTDKMKFTVVAALTGVMAVMCVFFMVGLFTPRVDNAELFKILGPAFMMIVGAFVNMLGYAMGKADRNP